MYGERNRNILNCLWFPQEFYLLMVICHCIGCTDKTVHSFFILFLVHGGFSIHFVFLVHVVIDLG